MEDNNTLIYYPQINHPLQRENDFIKCQYISLIKNIASQYEKNKVLIDYKLKALYYVLFSREKEDNSWINCTKQGYKEVFKTRFKCNKFFSYCTILLFDSVFLFAVNNIECGRKIKNAISGYAEKKYCKVLDVMFNELYHCNKESFLINRILPVELKQAWVSSNEFINSEAKRFIFTATMSAGKSTLINAIVGENISIAKKAACTTTIIKFNALPTKSKFHTIDSEEHLYFQDIKHVGDYAKMRQEPYAISGYFSSILHQRRTILIDTPGINSSLFPMHKKLTRNALLSIKDKIIVYVIPVETYGSKDDFDHLLFIKEHVNYENIVFLINMMDTCDLEDDSIGEIVENVRKHLIKIGFVNPLVYPISAKAGLLLKKLINGFNLTDSEKKSCNVYINLFNKQELSLKGYYPVAEKEVYDSVKDFVKLKDKRILTAYINTGVPELEKILFDI